MKHVVIGILDQQVVIMNVHQFHMEMIYIVYVEQMVVLQAVVNVHIVGQNVQHQADIILIMIVHMSILNHILVNKKDGSAMADGTGNI